MTSLFDEFLGEQLERIHVTPEGLGDYKTITFNFANGRCLTLAVELHSRKDAIYPAIRTSVGKWEMIAAEKIVEHKIGCAVFNDPPAGFASSVTDCDCGARPSLTKLKVTKLKEPSPLLNDLKPLKLCGADHKPGCGVYNEVTTKGFASSVSDCDCGATPPRLCEASLDLEDEEPSASLDEVDTCPISGEADCEDCQVNPTCDHHWRDMQKVEI